MESNVGDRESVLGIGSLMLQTYVCMLNCDLVFSIII